MASSPLRTQADLAKLVGVSQVTVHRALSGHPDVGAKTRQKILALARKYGYRPNASAATLRRGTTHTIGILVRTGTRGYLEGLPFFEFVIGLSDRLAELDYKALIVRDFELTEDSDEKPPLLFRERCIDGLIVTHSASAAFEKLIDSLHVPVVWLDSRPAEPTGTIVRDEAAAARLAVDELVRLGHRRIAYLECTQRPNDPEFRELFPRHHSRAVREAGYRDAVLRHALEPEVLKFRKNERGLRKLLDAMPSAADRPTAYVCYSVSEAFWIRSACEQRGWRIGQDVSIISLDSHREARRLWTKLGRVAMGRVDMGQKAADMMIRTLESGHPQPSICWSRQTLHGETFGPPADTSRREPRP